MDSCIFCKIVKGEIPSSKIYEDENVYSFLDINPAAKGHLLIIPKRHCESVEDLKKEEIISIFEAVKKITKALPLALDNSGYNLLMNYGRDAGQVIGHLHFHIIPRKKDDGLALSKWNFLKFSGDHLEEIAKSIREKIE